MASPDRSRSGQAAADYVAILALVAVVLAGAGAAVGGAGIASAITAQVRVALCRVSGAVCTVDEARRKGLPPCPVHLRDHREKLGGTVILVHLERGDTLAIERRSDGTASVSFADGVKAGVNVAAGVKLGPGAMVDAGGGAHFTAGRTWEFKTFKAAEKFVERYAGEETISGEIVNFGRGISPVHERARTPEPDARYHEGGGYGELGLQLGVPGIAGGSGRIESASVLGRKTSKHRTTWYLRLESALAIRLGALGLLAQKTDGGASAVAALTYERGRPAELAIKLGLALREGIAIGGLKTDLADLAEHARSLRDDHQSSTGHGGFAGEAEVSLDLRDPANAAAARSYMTALAQPWQLPAASAELARRLDADARRDVRVYRAGIKASEFAAGAGAGVNVQGAYARQEEGRELVEAYSSLEPGGSLRRREDCETPVSA